MDQNDLAHLYQSASSGEGTPQATIPSKELEEMSFKLQACVTWARVQLQDAGFETEQIVSDGQPELYLRVSRDGKSHGFRLCVPVIKQERAEVPSFGRNIVLAGNADGSLSAFRLYADDGSITMDRFEVLSQEIARHVATECGKKSRLNNTLASAI